MRIPFLLLNGIAKEKRRATRLDESAAYSPQYALFWLFLHRQDQENQAAQSACLRRKAGMS
jgi:hypothetical protein